jgi:glycine cleavage system H protein
MSIEKKVAVAVCTGMDQPLATVSRYAGYHVLEKLRPDKTVLLCTPALIGGVQEDVVFAKENPVLVIDGCGEKCCEKIVNEAKGQVKAVINVEDVLKEHKDLQPESRAKLGPKGMKLAEIVGELAARKVDEILGDVNKGGR